jgi:hypothetical protein
MDKSMSPLQKQRIEAVRCWPAQIQEIADVLFNGIQDIDPLLILQVAIANAKPTNYCRRSSIYDHWKARYKPSQDSLTKGEVLI